MASRFTFGRITAIGLVAGLVAGGATASFTLSRANFDRPGSGGDQGSFTRFSGNADATGGGIDMANRCPGCRDSYDMVYLNDPRRTRSDVRVGRGDRVVGGAPEAAEYSESLDRPPPETGWGDKRPLESPRAAPRFSTVPTPEEIARAEETAARDERMAQAARQIARTVVQTQGMQNPVTIHRPAPPPEPARPAPGPLPPPRN
ncbi:hypothetical protein FSZ31_04805 [Sphingorhabdus soli]|uniref:Uncharacterized protein n=1 Tax=Flavisphingopyxis soli TaxID=2601267 RepID=A0A5C6UNB0_9SPHN|nr:hypothetical protein [Sphingorhabdus soli]TXC74044.1 hypothetical protein FSZ31_04805 [Sphingorhabdus soli]